MVQVLLKNKSHILIYIYNNITYESRFIYQKNPHQPLNSFQFFPNSFKMKIQLFFDHFKQIKTIRNYNSTVPKVFERNLVKPSPSRDETSQSALRPRFRST